jgi:dTDP-4-dehydrorhamnose 3,5-epimerase
MIEGVVIKNLVRHSDDRGFFQEILRNDEELLFQFGQMSFSKTYPGVIKAFHYHKLQDDIWFFPVGNAQVVLYDTREDSPTFRETDSFHIGEDNPRIVLIPVGVAHGYRVLGNTPAIIIYLTTEPYNADEPDEYRIAWDDPIINYDWTTKNR